MVITLHTTHGDLKIEVFCEAVPRTSENFLALCASGAYDNTIFHRNIKGFMIQGGDPTGTGKGGQSIWGKPFPDEIRQTLRVGGVLLYGKSDPLSISLPQVLHFIIFDLHPLVPFNTRGVVAMANAGPDTNKAQFFITYAKQPSLDGKYSILGRVIDGADSTLDLMEKVPVKEKNRPISEIKLLNVTIHANPIADQHK
ncbi:peptidyl-prolyl cis-trans isomerase-like 3 [Tremella mesenterica]|uniref:Peptidyl-prolyl cis-trans isomerase n=1 Tax=Tremella mesenterica TaxID=5217 RepID=A0A4V1M3T7_TREME|nr:peptidyl-prolyl cis-trans isomerase-like 3 [Tremella mesenterica]